MQRTENNTFNIDMFLSSTELLLDKISNELQSIKQDLQLKCPKCPNEVRHNSNNEKWCVGCAMLINACKCT